jgi:hypothetical protein
MSHVHFLRFEDLEARRLLSKVHVAVAHPAPAAVPLMLDGTLAVNNNGASTTMNPDGSSTTTVPVAGRLGALGEVRGVWYENVDAYGDSAGSDTITLRNSKGAFGVAFNNQSSGQAHPIGNGAVSYEHAQRVLGGSGAYAHASESGSIELITNDAKTHVESLVLNTQNS